MILFSTQTVEQPQTGTRTRTEPPVRLVLWNDDHNTFEWVIECLVEVCRHTHEQAEQCAWLIHFNGRYAVKEGSYRELDPMRDALIERGLEATIE